MKLDKIIALANKNTELAFLAMERSLRDVGCQLPIYIIPYDQNLFEPPEGSQWWEVPEFLNWIDIHGKAKMMRKYQALLAENFQYVDTDVCFIRNPQEVLESHTGFVTTCSHWQNIEHIHTEESARIFHLKSTTSQRFVFSAGTFASESAIFSTAQELISTCQREDLRSTCLECPYNDQPGMNLMVLDSGVPITNLTLPPYCFESCWAGDYALVKDYTQYWLDPERKPYLIHWSGPNPDGSRTIDEIFYQYLTEQERIEWDQQIAESLKQKSSFSVVAKSKLRAAYRAFLSN